MPPTTFFRLLTSPIPAKGADLRAQIAALNAAQDAGLPAGVFQADPADFGAIPGTPFAYWVSTRVTFLFSSLEPTENGQRIVRISNETGDDFRFMRLWTEVDPKDVGRKLMWVPHAKGGPFRHFHYDLHLLVGWDDQRGTLRNYFGRPARPDERVACANLFFRPGLTYPRRTNRFSLRALPSEATFSNKGAAILVENDAENELYALLALMNSAPYITLIQLQSAASSLAQSFEVGILQRTPIPELSIEEIDKLEQLGKRSHNLSSDSDRFDETTHIFYLPYLGKHYADCKSLSDIYNAASKYRIDIDNQLRVTQRETDELIWDIYNLEDLDKENLLLTLETNNLDQTDNYIGDESNDDEDENAVENNFLLQQCVGDLIQWVLGVSFGRWDVYFALDPSKLPHIPGPFDPLPVCSPGMLVGSDGLPTTTAPTGYPLSPAFKGFLVDDPGHPLDIVAAVRSVLKLVWGERADGIEAEACHVLGAADLRTWLRDPKGFFAYHTKRYSKSRRKAPIYWLLQSAKRGYAIWLYYPRLNPDSLFYAAREYAEPKLNLETTRLDELQAGLAATTGSARTALERKIAAQGAFAAEIKSFLKALDAAALLELKPDLNDGVLLNIAPLRAIVPWKEVERTWQELLGGMYAWSSVGAQLKQKGWVKV